MKYPTNIPDLPYIYFLWDLKTYIFFLVRKHFKFLPVTPYRNCVLSFSTILYHILHPRFTNFIIFSIVVIRNKLKKDLLFQNKTKHINIDIGVEPSNYRRFPPSLSGPLSPTENRESFVSCFRQVPGRSHGHVIGTVVVIWTMGRVHPTDHLVPTRDIVPAPGQGSRPRDLRSGAVPGPSLLIPTTPSQLLPHYLHPHPPDSHPPGSTTYLMSDLSWVGVNPAPRSSFRQECLVHRKVSLRRRQKTESTVPEGCQESEHCELN